MKFKVSCDLDGVICDFYNPYLKRFGNPKKDSDITKNVLNVLRKDKEFWLQLPLINYPNFTVKQYTTSRSIPKTWIKEYLADNQIPKAPIYQLFSYCISKVPKIKMGGCDIHIDDSLNVFIDCNLHGIPCLLMDTPSNQQWGPIGRIYSLDKDEVEDCAILFVSTVYPWIEDLIYEFRRNQISTIN